MRLNLFQVINLNKSTFKIDSSLILAQINFRCNEIMNGNKCVKIFFIFNVFKGTLLKQIPICKIILKEEKENKHFDK